jgi:hypothetical protein
MYWGAFHSPLNSQVVWATNYAVNEGVQNTDVMGGFYMDDSYPPSNTIQQTNVYFHVLT